MSAVYFDFNYLFFVDPRVRKQFVDDSLSKVTAPDTVELIIGIWNEHDVESFVPVFRHLLKYNFKKITVVFDELLKEKFHNNFPNDLLDKIYTIFIDTWPIITVRACSNEIATDSWSPTPARGLFLTGKLDRPNRIGLLKKLYDANLLSNITYTFPFVDQQKSRVLSYYKDIVKEVPLDFEDFFNYCVANSTVCNEGIMYEAAPYLPNFPIYLIPHQLHKDTNYSIISETFLPDYNNNAKALITEKSYHPIIHRRPFVFAGPKGILEIMKNRGYKTFENYLPYPEYDSVTDHMQRMDLVAKNIAAFPDIMIKFADDIAKDVDHNFNLLQGVISDIRTTLEEFCISKGLPKSLIIDNINTLLTNISSAEELAILREKEQRYLKGLN